MIKHLKLILQGYKPKENHNCIYDDYSSFQRIVYERHPRPIENYATYRLRCDKEYKVRLYYNFLKNYTEVYVDLMDYYFGDNTLEEFDSPDKLINCLDKLKYDLNIPNSSLLNSPILELSIAKKMVHEYFDEKFYERILYDNRNFGLLPDETHDVIFHRNKIFNNPVDRFKKGSKPSSNYLTAEIRYWSPKAIQYHLGEIIMVGDLIDNFYKFPLIIQEDLEELYSSTYYIFEEAHGDNYDEILNIYRKKLGFPVIANLTKNIKS